MSQITPVAAERAQCAQTPAAYCRANIVRADAERRIVDSALAAGAACAHAPDGACLLTAAGLCRPHAEGRPHARARMDDI